MSRYKRPLSAAVRIGVSLEEFLEKTRAGRKWCPKCQRWVKRVDYVHNKASRSGYGSKCKRCARKPKTAPKPCDYCGAKKQRLVPFKQWQVCPKTCLESAKKLEA